MSKDRGNCLLPVPVGSTGIRTIRGIFQTVEGYFPDRYDA